MVNTSQFYMESVLKRKKIMAILAKCTFVLVAVALVVLSVVLVIDMAKTFNTEIRLEAGDELPDASEVVGKKDAKYEYDEEKIDISVPGEYTIYIVYGGNRRQAIKLLVVDTKPPKAAPKNLSVHVGGVMPEAADFFDKIVDATKVTASFSEPLPTSLGSHEIKIKLKDAADNKSTFTVTMNIIEDTEAPQFTYVPATVYGVVGQGISYKEGITYTDNCFGARLEVEDGDVDTKKAGKYTVVYHLIDAAGNRATATAEVVITDAAIDAAKLNEKIGQIAAENGMSRNLSREELCKKIYEYINDPTHGRDEARFKYVGDSNDPTRSDWRREAWLGLQNGEGDCYTYFALSKAFFEYFGFENMDIERTKGLTSDTHFWNMVNIGTASAPRWYFFDATRFAGHFGEGGNNGCLLTLSQLKSYVPNASGYGNNYYAFDASSYPSAQTKIINTNYSW